MLKKCLFAISLCMLLCLTACGAETPSTPPDITTETEAPADPSLTALRDTTSQKGDLCAAAYLGTISDDTLLESLLDVAEYPFLAEIPEARIIRQPGAQVYCLLPADGVSILVQDFVIDESNSYVGAPGETLYQSKFGLPVILIGNANDMKPNLLVTLTTSDGVTMHFNPSLNPCDGSLFIPGSNSLYDFSIYDNAEKTSVDADYLGTWQTAEGQPFCQLTFQPDEIMSCKLEDAAGQQQELNGTYYVIGDNSQYPAGSVLFEFKTDDSYTPSFYGIFTVNLQGDSLTVTHITGDPLTSGGEQASLTFSKN